jgi:arginyl-tRNA--protein-N-Asp/Glu arginylyltransferase
LIDAQVLLPSDHSGPLLLAGVSLATPHSSFADNTLKTPMLELSDHRHPCVYRPSQLARMPLLYPTRRMTGRELDEQLAAGRRRSGAFVYYTACPACSACEPSRIDVQRFELSRSMKRVLQMGDRSLETRIGPPCDDALRLELFNRHRQQRNLASSTDAYSFEDFHGFLVESCCESYELSFWSGDSLVACSIIDSGQQSVSAVYTYFDPRYARLSPGTYSILKQMEWAVGQGKRYLYLGMFVADNQHLRYKARFVPQERFIDGNWVAFDQPLDNWSSTLDKTESTE